MRSLSYVLPLVFALLTACSDSSSTIPADRLASPVAGGSEKPINPAWLAAANDLELDNPAYPAAGATNPLSVSIRAQQQSDPALQVTLTGLTNVASVQQKWTQISGPQAAILTPRALSTVVQLPQVVEPVLVSFRLSAADAQGHVNSSSTSVLITPLAGPAALVAVGVRNDDSYLFNVTLDSPALQPLSLTYTTEPGSALAEVDFATTNGNITIAVGEQNASFSIPIYANAARTDDVYFSVALHGDINNEPFIQKSIAVLSPTDGDQPAPNAVTQLTAGSTTQQELSGSRGVLRFYLVWEGDASDLAMDVIDPCGGITNRTNLAPACSATQGVFETTSSSENAVWANNAAPGTYSVLVKHRSGAASPFQLYVFKDGLSQTWTQVLQAGATLRFSVNVTGEIANPLPGLPTAVVLQPAADGSFSKPLLGGSDGDVFAYELINAPAGVYLDPITGVLTGDFANLPNLPLISANQNCLVAQADLTVKSGAADVLVGIDESGSMDAEHAWLGPMLNFLEQGLIDQGVGLEQENLYGMVGFFDTNRPHVFVANEAGDTKVSAENLPLILDQLKLTGGTEDGYAAIDVLLTELDLRADAGKNVILITDEDRDITDSAITYNTVLAQLDSTDATLNAVVNATFSCADGATAIGMDALGNGYVADGLGGYTRCSNARVVAGAEASVADYVNLAFANGGAAWNLNRLRSGGLEAQSFTAAFVDIKVKEIIQSLPPKESADLVISQAQLVGSAIVFYVKNRGLGELIDTINLSVDHLVNGQADQTLATTRIIDLAQGAEQRVELAIDTSVITDTVSISASTPTTECTTANNTSAFPYVVFKIDDGAGRVAMYEVLLNLLSTNSAPTITSNPTSTLTLGKAYEFQVVASDANIGESFYYQLLDAPNWLAIDELTGLISAKTIINSSTATTLSLMIKVADSAGETATQMHTITVEQAPVANPAL